MTIELCEIWDIENAEEYKVHFARNNGLVEPLEVWARSPDEWRGWQETPLSRHDFNRPWIFSLMRFYHEPDAWLFGGVFRVVERREDGGYQVELTDEGREFAGRLKLLSHYKDRNRRVNLDNQYANLEVIELLREPYNGTPFPGHLSINLSFGELETIVGNDRSDWKGALQHVSGIYVISDARLDRLYVGAAYGEGGVWSRWSNYVDSGDGGNVELRKVIGNNGLDYCRQHFSFALLEVLLQTSPDEAIRDREKHWKKVLLTRGRRGLNHN